MAETKLTTIENVTLYDVDGENFSEVNGVRQHVKFDAYECERGIDLTRSNITDKMMLNEDGGDKRLPSEFFAETITYWEPVEEQDEYIRDEIADYLQDYFFDELNEADEDAREYWKDCLKDELWSEYEIWLEKNSEYQDSSTRERKEAFLDEYLDDKDEILDFDEAMDELYEESDDEDSDEE